MRASCRPSQKARHGRATRRFIVDTSRVDFGTVSLIATLPILSILIVGSIYKVITNYQKAKQRPRNVAPCEIIEFDFGD